MANIYFITDGYFKEQYPMYNQLDMAKFYSTLLVEQQTTIEDWIGTILYDWYVDNANGALGTDELELFNQIQYALVFLTALQLILLNNTPTSDNKLRIESLQAKIAYLKAKMLEYIGASQDIQDIIDDGQTGGGSGSGTPSATPDDNIYDSNIYYWR